MKGVKPNRDEDQGQGQVYPWRDRIRDWLLYVSLWWAVIATALLVCLYLHMTGGDQYWTGIRGTALKCAPEVSCEWCRTWCEDQGVGPWMMDPEEMEIRWGEPEDKKGVWVK